MISLLIPTRRRCYNMFRLFTSCFQRCSNRDGFEVVWYIDDDDDDAISQFDTLKFTHHDRTQAIIGPRILMSQTHNECYKIAKGNIVAFAGDDFTFETNGWDSMVEAEFASCPDHILLVFGRDGINNEKLGVHAFLHRDAVEILGYVTPPIYSAFFADTAINESYENIGRRRYLPNLLMPHHHWSIGQAAQDQTTLDMLQRNARDHNEIKWHESLPLRIQDAQKLQAHINRLNGTNDQIKEYRRLL